MNAHITNMKGEAGGDYLTTGTTPGSWDAITALAAAVVDLTAPNISGTLTSVPIPAGVTIFGYITSITVTSGKVIAYKRR